jgi:hypothetical protein
MRVCRVKKAIACKQRVFGLSRRSIRLEFAAESLPGNPNWYGS